MCGLSSTFQELGVIDVQGFFGQGVLGSGFSELRV